MLPVLATLGPLTISSFGLFLALAVLMGLFAVWRVGRSYEMEGEVILDLVILVFVGGLLFSRAVIVLLHPETFDSLTKILLFTKYPGFSFWGGVFGGGFILWLMANRTKFHYWQLLDYAAVGLLIGIVFGDLGCFFGRMRIRSRFKISICSSGGWIGGKKAPNTTV